ncbi:MAG: uroporphyrinogen decarboxylase family protein [Candidatus Oleimicrobiaceae bacterium]
MKRMDFAPAVYEHAARLIGKTPWETSRNADLLFAAHEAAFRLYQHAPVVVGIDVYNLEPEAYGAVVTEPEGYGLPAVTGHPCAELTDIFRLRELDPGRDGRIPMVLAVGQKLRQALPEAIVNVPVSGPFSLASNLMGFESLLCALMTDAAMVGKALLHLVKGQLAFCKAALAQGLGITIFESAATPPLLSPALFAMVELPALTRLVQGASELLGRPAPCIVGGDTAPVAEMLFRTGAGYLICPSETDQPAFMHIAQQYPDVMVRINMDPWTLVSGDEVQLFREVDRVAQLASRRTRTCIGTGVLPYEAEPEKVLRVKAYVASL